MCRRRSLSIGCFLSRFVHTAIPENNTTQSPGICCEIMPWASNGRTWLPRFYILPRHIWVWHEFSCCIVPWSTDFTLSINTIGAANWVLVFGCLHYSTDDESLFSGVVRKEEPCRAIFTSESAKQIGPYMIASRQLAMVLTTVPHESINTQRIDWKKYKIDGIHRWTGDKFSSLKETV